MCPGHFGHIQLALPFMNPFFEKALYKRLQCVCVQCSRLLVPSNQRQKISSIVSANLRFQKTLKACKKIHGKGRTMLCEQCRAPVLKIDLRKKKKNGANQPTFANVTIDGVVAQGWDIHRIFDSVSEMDAHMMGFTNSHPRDYIIKLLPNSPPTIRPSFQSLSKTTTQNNLSQHLKKIVRHNNHIKQLLDLNPQLLTPGRIDYPEYFDDCVLYMNDINHGHRGGGGGSGGGGGNSSSKANKKSSMNSRTRKRRKLTAVESVVSSGGDNSSSCSNDITHEEPGVDMTLDNVQNEVLRLVQLIKTELWKRMGTLKKRLCKKSGRIRSNMMGKRGNYTGRTVISPNYGRTDELLVPEHMARILTIRERVTPWNIQKMTEMVHHTAQLRKEHDYQLGGCHSGLGTIREEIRDVKTKPTHWSYKPGITEVTFCEDGRSTHLDFDDPRTIVLSVGDKVERHLRDGDVVICGRNPSLHKHSIMAHTIRIWREKTIGLTSSCTGPYNADFDGDEMNIYVPRGEKARAEARHLMLVSRQLRSPKDGRNAIGFNLDEPVAAYQLTAPRFRISRQLYFTCIAQLDRIPYERLEQQQQQRQHFGGHELFSTLLPTYFNFRVGSAKDNTLVEVLSGNLIPSSSSGGGGRITKGTLNRMVQYMSHLVQLDLERGTFEYTGNREANRFIEEGQRLLGTFYRLNGCTVSFKDLETPEIKKIREATSIVLERINEFEREDEVENREIKVCQLLNDLKTRAIETAIAPYGRGEGKKKNQLLDIIESGAKGSHSNYCQMTCFIGSQFQENRRFFDPSVVTNDRRISTVEKRGFVPRSFVQGLTPQQYIYHAHGTREGLVSTAVGTRETGYIQRRIARAIDDVAVKVNGTVSFSSGAIVDILYGGDHFNPEFLLSYRPQTMCLGDTELRRHYCWEDQQWGDSDILQKEWESIRHFRGMYIAKELLRPPGMKAQWSTVIPWFQLWSQFNQTQTQTKTQTPNQNQNQELSPPLPTREKAERAAQRLAQFFERIAKRRRRVAKGSSWKHRTWEFPFFENLSSKVLLQKHRIPERHWPLLFDVLSFYVARAEIGSGENMGMLSAQSIAEPSMQLTMNTFHTPGAKSTLVSGIPRMKDIMSAIDTVKMKTPRMTIFLRRLERCDPKTLAFIVSRLLPSVTLGDLVQDVCLVPPPETKSLGGVMDWGAMWKLDKKLFNQYLMTPKSLFENIVNWFLHVPMKGINSPIGQNRLSVEEGVSWELEKMDDMSLVFRMSFQTHFVNTFLRPFLRKFTHVSTPPSPRYTIQYVCVQLQSFTTIEGVPGVKSASPKLLCVPHFNRQRGGIDQTGEEWVVEADGTNLKTILSLPFVDSRRTTSNNILEVYSILGISATLTLTNYELQGVLQANGSSVYSRHTRLLASIMARTGKIRAVTRNGIMSMMEPLQLISFEDEANNMVNITTFGDTDHTKSVTANIMIGNLCQTGSNAEGCQDIVVPIDENLLMEAESHVVKRRRLCKYPAPLPLRPNNFIRSFGVFLSGGVGDVANMVDVPQVSQHIARRVKKRTVTRGGGGTNAAANVSSLELPWSHKWLFPGNTKNVCNLGMKIKMVERGHPQYEIPPFKAVGKGGRNLELFPTPQIWSVCDTVDCDSPPFNKSDTASGFGFGFGFGFENYCSTCSKRREEETRVTGAAYSPTSPSYYCPTSPSYNPNSNVESYSPTSPSYCPTSPTYCPTSPSYNPNSATTNDVDSYSPASPGYNPADYYRAAIPSSSIGPK